MRWLALLAILANVVFNAVYTAIKPGNPTIAEVTYQYGSLFMPAGYAFSIWGLIYLSFIVYGIAQLVPKVKHNVTYNKLALPMLLTNVLSIVWIVAYTANNIAASLMLMGGMLVLGGFMFLQAQKCYKAGWAPGLLLVPFSLFLGWISVASIANASIFLKSISWGAFDMPEENWAIIMAIVAGLLGIVFSIKTRNYTFPAVIVWALVAIYIQQQYAYSDVAMAALISAVVTAFFTLVAFFRPGQYNKARVGTQAPTAG